MKKLLTLKFLFFVFISTFAQEQIDFSDYKPLICKGEIPEDFRMELSRQVDLEKQNQSGAADKVKKQAVKFSELSTYQLKNILYSGKVLYGDVLTDYVNKVADVILEKDKNLRGKVRFYVLKHTDLNAYSTQSGIIFISLGLLAQIENEAQLAFIMCHEIVHFRNNHNLETYKKRDEVLKNGSASLNGRVSSMLNYSKDNELEADREGLEIFLKTPYGTGELNDLFDVLLYSYLPFDELAFDTLYFNSNKGYVIPGEYFLTEVSEIKAEEDVTDSMSTHPNIKKRRERIQEMLKKKDKKEGVSFLNTEEVFDNIQRIARYELAIVYLQDAELENAFYAGYLIEKNYGKSMFSDKIIASALYAKSKQKSANYKEGIGGVRSYTADDFEDGSEWRKIEGELQAVYHFMHKIPAKELSILAARKLFELNKLYNESFFTDRFSSAVYDLVNNFGLKQIDFMDAPKSVGDTILSDHKNKSEISGELLVGGVNSEKYSKISKIKKTKETKVERKSMQKGNKYYKYAFVEYFQDSLLKSVFDLRENQMEEEEKLHETKNYTQYIAANNKIVNKYGQGLNIDKMVMINPFFSSYTIKSYYDAVAGSGGSYVIKNPAVSPLEEEQVEQNLLNFTRDFAHDLGLDVSIIGGSQQSSIETDRFNDFQQMINWLSERVALGKMGAHTFSDQYIDKYVTEYGYLGFCRVVKLDKELSLVFVLFNLRTGGSELYYEKGLKKGKPDGVWVKMMLYDAMHQVKQEAGKINRLIKKYHINE